MIDDDGDDVVRYVSNALDGRIFGVFRAGGLDVANFLVRC